MKAILPALALGVAIQSAPALADVAYAVTPSGRTEAYFDLPVVGASDKIANGCADMGWTLINSTSTVVTCEAQMGTMQSVLAALLIGNKYSTPPKQYIRFNIAGSGRASRVQATGWIETQMAFGQTRTAEMTAAHYHNNVMQLFLGLGGRFPPGTSFPNHAFFGSQFQEAGGKGLVITEMQPGSPIERSGAKSGDLITRLAKERIKSGNDLLDGLRKAVKSETYEVEVMRAGQSVKLTVPREYRGAVEGPALADLPPEADASALAQQIVPLSPADELAKFAKLKADGVISDAEFEAQKKRLLGI